MRRGRFDESAREKEASRLALLIRERARVEYAQENFKEFLKLAWEVMSPGTEFQDNWHIDCLCEHLEAMARRDIRRLIINLPPRSLKSSIISVAFPAWRWIHDPAEKFLCASYGRQLALRDSRRCRNLIASPWYQSFWSSKFGLASDQNEKGRFENDKGGFRIIASVEGGILGEGGSFSIYDDANDVERMSEEEYPQSVRDWYSGSASSRFIDPRTDVRINVQQRMPYGNDLTAFLMELGGWEQVSLPMEFEGSRKVTSIGWSDPREHLGELMFPARYGPEELEPLKREQKDNWAGQYQQRPISGVGSSLRREWFKFYNPPGVERVDEFGKTIPVRVTGVDGKTVEITPVALPAAMEQVVQSWDFAFKSQEHNDFVAGHAWGRLGANCYLVARNHGHWSFTESLRAIRSMSINYPCPEKLVEDAANGPAILDTLQNEIPGLVPVKPAGGKWARLSAIRGYVEAGNVYLPNPDIYPWVWDLLTEFYRGRESEHDDDTDAMTQALKRLYDGMARAGAPEFRVEPRLGEPRTACHIDSQGIPREWRRFVAILPGRAAVWLAESPTGSLRVVREADLGRADAVQAGRLVAAGSLADLPRTEGSYDLLMPKEAFAEIASVGSWAEMLEASLLAWEPEGDDYDGRLQARDLIRAARFRSEMVEEEEAAIDRLRSLLAFMPPDFAPEIYVRDKALALAERDLSAYADYMAAVDGEVRGEWPKLKILPACKQLIAELGVFRQDLDAPPFVATLLLGVSAPPGVKKRRVVEIPVSQRVPQIRNQSALSRKFALGRR